MVTVAREKEVGTNGFTVKKPSSVNWSQFNSKDSVEVAKGLSNDDNTSRLRHFLFKGAIVVVFYQTSPV